MLTLYDAPESGNCYKVRLLLELLVRPYRRVLVDLSPGGTRPEELVTASPGGRVPMLRLPSGRCLVESGAILWHLARGTRWLPDEPLQQDEVLRWLLFEQNSVEANIAVARHWMLHLGNPPDRSSALALRVARGAQALDELDAHLRHRSFVIGRRLTIADIALFGYVHLAPDCGLDLARWQRVGEWIERVRETPGFVPMAAGSGRSG